MATASQNDGPWLLLIGGLVVLLLVLGVIAGFANAVETLLLNSGMPPQFAGPVGSVLFFGIILGLLGLTVRILLR